jgi:hypothetical protein
MEAVRGWWKSLQADSEKARQRRLEWYESELRWLEHEHERLSRERDAYKVEARA